MSYDFEKDASSKSFEMKLDNDTIMTAFITTDEEADGTLPELSDGVYGGLGFGPMSPDFEFLGSGGGGSSDFSTAEVTITNAHYEDEDENELYYNIPVITADSIDIGNTAQTTEIATVTVPLYKGKCVVFISGLMASITDITGNANYTDNLLTITGDCAFTYTESRG